LTHHRPFQVVGNDRMFASLNDLVSHHNRHAVTNDGDTLLYPAQTAGDRQDLQELDN